MRRLLAALVIALLPGAALAQYATGGAAQSGNATPAYGGGSAYTGGSSGYAGPSIDSPGSAEAGAKPATQEPELGGNYRYGDRSARRSR